MGKPPRRAGVVVERPHRRRGSRRDHGDGAATCAGVPRANRRHVFVRMVVVEDLEMPEGGARGVRRRGELGGARRLRARGSGQRRRSQGHRSQCVRRRPQGDVLGRVGRPAIEDVSRAPGSASSPSCAIASTIERLPPGTPAGHLSGEWANVLGLREGITIAMGGFDAHYGAVGSGIQVGTLVKIIGTSTCDCAIAAGNINTIPGICGIVNGSIMPGFYRHRSGAVGRRRPPEVVGRGRLRRRRHGKRRCDPCPARAVVPRSGGARTGRVGPDRRSTGTTATAPSWSIPS